MANSISTGTLLGWTVREPDKALVVQQSYDITLNDVKSTAVQTTTFMPGANLDSLPTSVTDVIGHVWTPEVLAAQTTAAEAAEAARLAAFNAAIAGLQQAQALAQANGQDGIVGSLQGQINQLNAARDAGQLFQD